MLKLAAVEGCSGPRTFSRIASARSITASRGYDSPLHPSFADHNIWQDISPPQGGQYNYPVRGDEQLVLVGYPARPAIAAQINAQGVIPNLVARVTQGKESFDDAIAWAENEMEGFMRG